MWFYVRYFDGRGGDVTRYLSTGATSSRGFRVIVATTPLVATESIVSAVVYSSMPLVTG